MDVSLNEQDATDVLTALLVEKGKTEGDTIESGELGEVAIAFAHAATKKAVWLLFRAVWEHYEVWQQTDPQVASVSKLSPYARACEDILALLHPSCTPWKGSEEGGTPGTFPFLHSVYDETLLIATKALQDIKSDEGPTCDDYAQLPGLGTCKHPACHSSRASWITADLALSEITTLMETLHA